MPGPLLAAAIGAGSNLLQTGANALFTGAQNRKARRWASAMYNKQYEDNIAFWNMQNSYNTPQAQMQRFQDAGLNPNLIYGQGNAGNAGVPSTPDIQRPQFSTPDTSGIGVAGSELMKYFDMRLREAQTDQVRANTTVALEDATLKAAQRANIEQGTKRSIFDLDLDSELRSVSAQARRENLRQIQIGNQVTLDRNEREALSNVASLRESIVRVLNMRLEGRRLKAVTANVWKDSELKQLDIEMRENGIMPGHPMYAQILGRILNKVAPRSGSVTAPIKKNYGRFRSMLDFFTD